MSFSPRKRARSTFDQTWHDTDATFLNPTTMPIAKVPRAWERKPEVSKSRDGKERKVWRRYGLRSAQTNTTASSADEVEDVDSPGRAIKKLRVQSTGIQSNTARATGKTRSARATRWDRRKSALPRKMRPNHDAATDDVENAGDVSEDDADEATEELLSDTEIDAEPKLVPSESAIGEDDERAQFSFRLEVSKDAPAPTEDVEESTDRIKQTEPEPNTLQDELSMPIRSSPQKGSRNSILKTFGDEEIQSTKGSHTEIMDVQAVAPEFAMEEVMASHGQLTEASDAREDSGMSIVERIEPAPIVPGTRESDCADHNQAEESLVQVNKVTDITPPKDIPERVELSTDIDEDSAVPETSIVERNESMDFGSPTVEMSDSEPLPPALSREVTVDTEQHSAVVEEDNRNSVLISSSKEATTSESLVSATEEDVHTSMQASFTVDAAEDEDIAAAIEENTAIPPVLETAETEDMPSAMDEDDEPLPLLEETAEATTADLAEGDVQLPSEQDVEEAENIPTGPSENQMDADQDMGVDDIADGLVLGSSFSNSVDPQSSGVLRSPPPSQTETRPNETLHLDDDTAILKDFLTRAAANKASKANITRRESLQNRRDSGAVRQALASPRKILEDKDPNSPSPRKMDDNTATLDLSQTLTLNLDDAPQLSPTPDRAGLDGTADVPASPSLGSRRSARTRKTRIPHPPSGSQAAQTPKNISIRRADGSEPVALRKTEAQELALLTRTNTRKNKQGAVNVALRLLKLSAEKAGATTESTADSAETSSEEGKRKIHWDEQLVYYQEPPETTSNTSDPQADEEDELNAPITTPKPRSQTKPKSSQKDKEKEKSTPRIRRLRGLGAANGTPAKGLLAPSSLLPTEVQEEREDQKQQQQKQPRIPKPSRTKKLPVSNTTTNQPSPTLDLVPTGIPTTATPAPKDAKLSKEKQKERKSRLATPRKLKLPQPTTTSAGVVSTTGPPPPEEKENHGVRPPLKGLPVPTPVMLIPATAAGLPVARRGRPRRGV